jgi:hypothetical protein
MTDFPARVRIHSEYSELTRGYCEKPLGGVCDRRMQLGATAMMCGPARTLDLRQVVGAVHQRHVRERLGEVAELAPGLRVILLGEESHVVGEAD